MIVEAGFADRHHLGMLRVGDQFIRRDVELFVGVMRMRADRAPDLRIRLGDCRDFVEAVNARRDRHHAVDTVGLGAFQHARAVGCEPNIEIERRLEGAERVGAHKTSTLIDLEAGKTLELGAIVTAVVELADLAGVAAPSLRAIAASTELLAMTLGLTE